MRLIDADRLETHEQLDPLRNGNYEYVEVVYKDDIDDAPTIEPERRWIPCSDPSDLPKDERLWITREISDGFFTLREVSDVIWDMTEWSDSVSNVVAYMPYWEPEPYTERREE